MAPRKFAMLIGARKEGRLAETWRVSRAFWEEVIRANCYFCVLGRSPEAFPLAAATCRGVQCLSLVEYPAYLISLRAPLDENDSSSTAFIHSVFLQNCPWSSPAEMLFLMTGKCHCSGYVPTRNDYLTIWGHLTCVSFAWVSQYVP